MKTTPIAQLWQMFSLETRQQVIHLWADLAHRQIQAQRLLQQGETDEFLNEDPSPTPDPASNRLHSPVNAQASPTQSGEYPTTVSTG